MTLSTLRRAIRLLDFKACWHMPTQLRSDVANFSRHCPQLLRQGHRPRSRSQAVSAGTTVVTMKMRRYRSVRPQSAVTSRIRSFLL